VPPILCHVLSPVSMELLEKPQHIWIPLSSISLFPLAFWWNLPSTPSLHDLPFFSGRRPPSCTLPFLQPEGGPFESCHCLMELPQVSLEIHLGML
jgi:hypothetical protein